MNTLSLSPGKNGYPSYQATVASMTSSSSVVNSTGDVTALLNSVNLGGDEPTTNASPPKERVKSPLVGDGGGGGSGGAGAMALSMSSTSQNKLDSYEMMTTVGTGTFGRVVVVRHRHTKEFFALKIMSIAEVLRLKQTDHVRNEKEILSQVSHPFIINL